MIELPNSSIDEQSMEFTGLPGNTVPSRLSQERAVYLYLDESGSFSGKGKTSKGKGRYFNISCVMTKNPMPMIQSFTYQRFTLMKSGDPRAEEFHAERDGNLRIDSLKRFEPFMDSLHAYYAYYDKHTLEIEECRVDPLYVWTFEQVLNLAIEDDWVKTADVIYIMPDAFPGSTHDSQKPLIFAKNMCKRLGKEFGITFMTSAADPHIQIADYLAWSVNRKLSKDEEDCYQLFEPIIIGYKECQRPSLARKHI